MLLELHITDLGIIEELHLLIGPGLTAITGETGAGKTLITGAIALLAGERAGAGIVRDGASEAKVEGRFEDRFGVEVVLARVVPVEGRSRAYVDGRLATAAELARLASELLDLHAQHAHHALLEPAAQRRILDAFAGTPAADALASYRSARAELAVVEKELASLGGDHRMRAREISLLEFQVAELGAAGLDDPLEEAALEDEEQRLANAQGLRESLMAARAAIDGPVADGIASAAAAVGSHLSLASLETRVRSLQAEAVDLAHDLREDQESIVDDPERLELVRARRHLFRQLERKYGVNLAAVIEFREEAASRLEALLGFDGRVGELETTRSVAETEVMRAAEALRAVRVAASEPFAAAVTARLRELAMPEAWVGVELAPVGVLDDGADEVTMVLAANPGEPPGALARVASGGERSRALLAVRVAAQSSGAVPGGRTLVFDEVDAGVGGEAGAAVGRALADLAGATQVLCVTHLAQVAACAHTQVVVRKGDVTGRTIAKAGTIEGEDRVIELSRMLAGLEKSDHARRHAEELLARAGAS